jgi:hypothetical protein
MGTPVFTNREKLQHSGKEDYHGTMGNPGYTREERSTGTQGLEIVG